MKLLSSSSKRYLGGGDWSLAALNRGTLETTGRKSFFHLVVFLDGALDIEQTEAAFRRFCKRFPVLWGELSRSWCGMPYWKYVPCSDKQTVSVSRSSLPREATREDVIRQIESLSNEQRSLRECATALHSIRMGEAKSVVVCSFDHHLFDAVGAEAFIDLFFRTVNGDTSACDFPGGRPTKSAQWGGWIQRVLSGCKVFRFMHRLRDAPTAHLPLPEDTPQRPFRFRVMSFDEEESKQIKDQSFKVAGYLMFMPYVLATAAAVFRPLFRKRMEKGSQFVISVTTDKPKTTAVSTPHFFFNDLSFVYFFFPLAAATERDALAGELREQLIAQVKEGIPAAFEDTSLLMRVLTARRFWKVLMRLYHNRLASFAFTCLGTPALKTPAVLGCPVRIHIHFPIIPTPPGIGLVLCQSGGGYHAVLSYIEGILQEEEVDSLFASFREKLLDTTCQERKT